MSDQKLSPFQSMIKQDVTGVFLNQEEFASVHLIEEKEVMAVVDTDDNQPMNKGFSHGLDESIMTIYAKATDLPRRRSAGQILNVDGSEYTVDKWENSMGMAVISLSHPESY